MQHHLLPPATSSEHSTSTLLSPSTASPPPFPPPKTLPSVKRTSRPFPTLSWLPSSDRRRTGADERESYKLIRTGSKKKKQERRGGDLLSPHC
ncbi:hypothetical protein MRB53_027783 [Persea americana]|uniref:Uncharacterized protein n=1 Tax=Persea americana TaxID=3435 RepID=A0ACC2LM12_PERAE|nr:hypothetical protein MRB53_027783 [Persea americana]